MSDTQPTWMVIGMVLLLIFSVIQMITIFSHKQIMSPTQPTSAGSSDGGETNEQMMARMHPDQVAAASSPQAQMVGGC